MVENLGNGEYATAGDSNATYDASAITSEDIEARATLLVPFVGRPLAWLSDGNIAPAGLRQGHERAYLLGRGDLNGASTPLAPWEYHADRRVGHAAPVSQRRPSADLTVIMRVLMVFGA